MWCSAGRKCNHSNKLTVFAVNKAQSLVTSAIMALADREAKLTIEREGYRSAAVQCNVFKEKVKRPGKVKSDKIQQPRHEVRAPMKRL